MLMQNPLHTPDEMREISNLAHILEGVVLGLAALIALLQARGLLQGGWPRYAWPALVCIAGAFLLGYLVIPHHGLDLATTQWRFVFGDVQQRQHIVISLLILLGGLVELLVLRGVLQRGIWRFVWPAAIVIVGLLFILHRQHGTSDAMIRATLLHRVLGSMLFLAGVLAALNVRRPTTTLATAWPLALLAAAAILLIYREPLGAYEHPGAHDAAPP